MSYKMSELVEKTSVSKSTILYYVKEGLLPEPKKPKPNVHLYDDSTVDVILLIKFLQESMHYSISEIKTILEENSFDFDHQEGELISYLSALFAKTKPIKNEMIDPDIEPFLFREKGKFYEEEKRVFDILKTAKEEGVDFSLFETYAKRAKELAILEYEIAASLLTGTSSNEKNRLHRLIFDIFLVVKPYIFNQTTINEHKKRLKDRV